jgi:hypothetical protein
MPESSVDIRDVLVGLRKMERAATTDAGIFWREMKVEAKAEIRSHRRGVKRRTSATKEEHGPGRTLGKLLTAYRTFTDPSGLTMRHQVDWALVQHTGGKVGNKATLPARPFAYFGGPFVRSTADSYAAFAVKQGWNR